MFSSRVTLSDSLSSSSLLSSSLDVPHPPSPYISPNIVACSPSILPSAPPNTPLAPSSLVNSSGSSSSSSSSMDDSKSSPILLVITHPNPNPNLDPYHESKSHHPSLQRPILQRRRSCPPSIYRSGSYEERNVKTRLASKVSQEFKHPCSIPSSPKLKPLMMVECSIPLQDGDFSLENSSSSSSSSTSASAQARTMVPSIPMTIWTFRQANACKTDHMESTCSILNALYEKNNTSSTE